MRLRSFTVLGVCAVLALAGCAEMQPGGAAVTAKPTPAQGYRIHVMAPHKFEDGTVHGPFHHYCKPISPEIIQCLLFESTDPNALLTDIEYFVAKSVSRAHVPLDTWNKFYHDHEVEIATGRVQVLDMPEAQAKEIAAVAAKTDGIIFHLWPDGKKAPMGRSAIPRRLVISSELSSHDRVAWRRSGCARFAGAVGGSPSCTDRSLVSVSQY